jgi:putative DNA primase/helicase
VETYLREARGIPVASVPEVLRWADRFHHWHEGRTFNAMVAHVTTPTGKTLGCHVTYLKGTGRGKADAKPNRMMIGPVAGGAVQLAPAGPVLAVAEGIETALAFMVATGHPTWAALSAPNMQRMILPALPMAAEVIVAADNDEAGRAAADALAARCESEGRQARIALPPLGLDFADLLRMGERGDGQALHGAVVLRGEETP